MAAALSLLTSASVRWCLGQVSLLAHCLICGSVVADEVRLLQVSLLVTTPLATRGLDFPNITHVYNLGIVGSAGDYLHRAGRCGRIGQDVTLPGGRRQGLAWSLCLPRLLSLCFFCCFLQR